MNDPSEATRDRIRKKLGQIEAEERANDASQEKLAKAGWEHHDIAQNLARESSKRAEIADSDSPDALLYEEALEDQRRGALVGGHMDRATKGEN